MSEPKDRFTVPPGEAIEAVPDRTDRARLRDLSEEEIERMAAEDEENPATSEQDWADAFVGLPPENPPPSRQTGSR